MSDIIEKLGITPGPWESTLKEKRHGEQPVYLLSGSNPEIKGSCFPILMSVQEHHIPGKEDRNIITAAPKMLKALIDQYVYFYYYEETDCENDIGVVEIKKIIEEATGRSWDEVKELLEGK